jgi:putative tricarboxylic transport membrane protein
MPMSRRDIIAAIMLLFFSALYAWAAFDIPNRTIPNTPGPSFFPFVIITIVGILSLALLAKGISGLRSDNNQSVQTQASHLPATTMVVFLVYLVLLPWIGFVIASIAFFAILMLLYGCRKPVKIVIWSLVLPVGLFVIFTQAFQILLPSGPLGF